MVRSDLPSSGAQPNSTFTEPGGKSALHCAAVSCSNSSLTSPFTRPHAANDVHVTGTFDDWGKTEKLEKVGDVFEKEVTLPSADEKYYYKVRALSGFGERDNRESARIAGAASGLDPAVRS
jgi:hypothetical protein